MHAAKILYYRVDQYLDMERESEKRHEYVHGEMLAMTCASATHNVIAGNLFSALHAHLRGSPCRTYMNDMKLEFRERRQTGD